MNVVVIGASVGGLAAALTLSRDGHDVTIIERDATPLPDDPGGAFEWDRRGAPQVRHSHAFLARLRNLLRDRYPDVLEALFDAGATEMDFIEMLPEGMDRTRIPGDEDLVALACRRTTFEWVLRRIVLAEDHVRLLDGRTATSLRWDQEPGAAPHVAGIEFDDGEMLDADLVVAAGGRRMPLPSLLQPMGIDLAEHTEDTGIIYMSRFFALDEGAAYPAQTGPIGGDLGYLKYGVFQGDNRTFSITFAVGNEDEEMRRILLDPERFLSVAANLPATAPYVDGRATPTTEVFVMAKLINRRRHFVSPDGDPLVTGLVALGDAHTCTNPLYGRGCSLAMVQAELLADAVRASPTDPVTLSSTYERTCEDQVLPWYRAAIAQDAANRSAVQIDAAARRAELDAGDKPVDSPADEPPDMRLLMRDGLLPAMRTDPVVLRAFLRMFNLLEAPDSLLTNWDVVGRVMSVYQDRDQRPPEPALGPGRSAMVGMVHGAHP